MAFMRIVEVIVETNGGEGIKVEDFKIAFSIEKSDSPDLNTSTIKIYNLSNETSSQIAVANNHIQLRAGYEDESVRAIFFGTVLSGKRYRSGEDFITELQVQDGRAAVMGGHISVSFAKEVEATTVVQSFLDAIGLPFKGLENVPEEEKYTYGFAHLGMASEGLRKVLNRFDLTYTIQNEMLYILKPGEEVERTGLRLTAETGLLTIPQPVSDKTGIADINADTLNCWQFSTLLFSELIPGAACKVESSSFTGEVLIYKAIYEGDNWGGNFKINIEAEAL
jgi:hypothetical protein